MSQPHEAREAMRTITSKPKTSSQSDPIIFAFFHFWRRWFEAIRMKRRLFLVTKKFECIKQAARITALKSKPLSIPIRHNTIFLFPVIQWQIEHAQNRIDAVKILPHHAANMHDSPPDPRHDNEGE